MATTDDIFARPPRSARRRTDDDRYRRPTGMVGRNACIVCDMRADTLVCLECSQNLPLSKGRLKVWMEANKKQANILLDAWDAVRAPQQAAWERVMDARDQPNYAARCAAHRAAGNVYGVLLDAHAAYEADLQPLDIERARLEKALEVLSTL